MQAWPKDVAESPAHIPVSVEFCISYLQNMLHSGGYKLVIHHHLPVPLVLSIWESVSINMPSLWD
jgi:hypothetical protein